MPFTFQEALDFVKAKRVVLPAEYYGELQGQSRSRAFSIAGIASRDQLQGVLDSLNDVLRKGTTFAEWKNLASTTDLGLEDYRLDNIFRTNMQSAYSAGHWAQQQRMKDKRPYLMYDAVNDLRVRPSHLALDNIIRPIDDPFWATFYPPNGYRCRCSTISLTEAQANARGGVSSEPEGGFLPPDKGWDYNGSDIDEGLRRGARQSPRGDTSVQRAMERTVAEQRAAVDSLQQAKASGRPVTKAELEAWVGGKVPREVVVATNEVLDLLALDEWDASVFREPLWSFKVAPSAELITVNGHPASAQYWSTFRELKVNADAVPHLSSSQMRGVIAHELGHHLDYTTLKTLIGEDTSLRARILDEYYSAVGKLAIKGKVYKDLANMHPSAAAQELMYADVQAVSIYALSNDREWIAESFMTYLMSPNKLRVVAPKTFAVFEELKNGVAP